MSTPIGISTKKPGNFAGAEYIRKNGGSSQDQSFIKQHHNHQLETKPKYKPVAE